MIFFSVAEAWKAVIDKHEDARNDHRMKQLSFTSVKAVQMFGLDSSAMTYLVEQLFGAEQTHNYIFKHHDYERDVLYEVSCQMMSYVLLLHLQIITEVRIFFVGAS